MSNSVAKRREEQLGMPYGTACARLRKSIMFSLIKECGKAVCFRCQKPILTERELSIDHINWWENIDSDLFWDLNNVAFSHLRCNTMTQRRGNRKRVGIVDYRKCSFCKEEYPIECFHKDKGNPAGVSSSCIPCNHLRKGRKQNKTYSRLVDQAFEMFETEVLLYRED